jgi:hypothetical protein
VGVKELKVALRDGTDVKGLLDAQNLTTRVEMKMGAQVPSADYAGYKDFQDYGVMFPSRIVQKVDGPRRRRPDGHRGVGQSLSDLSAAEGILAEITSPLRRSTSGPERLVTVAPS